MTKDNIDIKIDIAYKWDVILTLAGTDIYIAYTLFPLISYKSGSNASYGCNFLIFLLLFNSFQIFEFNNLNNHFKTLRIFITRVCTYF